MVKVWSDEEVRELRSGYWAVMLDSQGGGASGYLRFTTEQSRREWVSGHSLRLPILADSVPLSLLLDREAWSEKVVNLSAKRKATVLFATA